MFLHAVTNLLIGKYLIIYKQIWKKKKFSKQLTPHKKNCASQMWFACGNKSFIWRLAIQQWAPIPGLPSILFIAHILLPSLKRDFAKTTCLGIL